MRSPAMLVAILARPYSTSSTRLLHRSLQRHPEVMSGWYELPEAARVTHCMCCILHHSQNSLKRRSKNMGWLQPDILQVYSTRWSVETNRRANRTGTHDDLVRDRVQGFWTDSRVCHPRCCIYKYPDPAGFANAICLRLLLEDKFRM